MSDNAWWKGRNGEWYVVVQFIFFGLLFVSPFLFRTSPWPSPWSTAARVAGILLGFAGLGLIGGGLINLGSNLTAVPRPKEDAHFVEHGAYRLVRHPIYSGIILGGFGWALMWNSLPSLLIAVALFVFLDVKSRREETWLTEKYPEYPGYRQRVRKLIPFVY